MIRFIITSIALLIVIPVLIYQSEKISCGYRWGDFETVWRPFAGCMVKIDGKFVPQDNVRF